VRQGNWNPDNIEADRKSRDPLAARGYWQAFQVVKESVRKVLAGENPGARARAEHKEWYVELFQPCVTAGLFRASDLAGYRNNAVYLRTSRYAPPRWEAVRDAMPAFFDLLEKETELSVRAVLGHWLFGYIHPYPDGNGRMTRFLMNVMLASGGYPWTVIRMRDRKAYLAALDRASIDVDLGPFTTLIAQRVRWALEKHDLKFPDQAEKWDFDREVVLLFGQDGDNRVRCAISREALDDDFRGDGRDKVEVFRENRAAIEQGVRQKYAAGDTETDASVLIHSGELAKRKGSGE
jgi:fido (protein-threonine AMPylation protein)